jgi:dihydroflavonol-4-reductase
LSTFPPEHPTTLVTGATGLLGSVLVRRLVAAGEGVRILRRPASRLDLLGKAARAVDHAVGDLADARSVRRAMRGVARVHHVAARVGRGASANALRATNVEGTANVVNAALSAGVGRLVHVSSIAALGHPLDPREMIDEATPWREGAARGAYARSKRDAELEVHRGIAEGLDAVIVNPGVLFGVGRAGENTRRFVDAVRRGWLPGLPPGGSGVVDAEDVAAALCRAMAEGETGQRYVLVSENLTWHAMAAALARAFGVRPPTRTLPPWLLRGVAAVSEAAAFVTRRRPWLARAEAEALVTAYRYDAARARAHLGCTFRPFAATARRLAEQIAEEPAGVENLSLPNGPFKWA